MISRLLACPQCDLPLAREFWNTGALRPCGRCATKLELQVFPAYFRPITRGAASEAVIAEEASCFYHPAKQAKTPCDRCGRFLCALCDVEIEGEHLCPACLASGQKKGRLRSLQRERLIHDQLALTLALAPLLVPPLTLITAPIALYLAIRHWNAPGSIIPRVKWRGPLAIVLSLAQIAAWTYVIIVWRK